MKNQEVISRVSSYNEGVKLLNMKITYWCSGIIMLFTLVFLSGCVEKQRSFSASYGEGGNYTDLLNQYREKAQGYEREGALREALQSWQVVEGIQSGDSEVRAKIRSLQNRIEGKAEKHFHQGVRLYRSGRYRDARKEFLLTLAYDPEHRYALEYVQARSQQPVFETYITKPGDTIEKITAKKFKSLNREFLVTAFNTIEAAGKLESGMELDLPILGKEFLKRRPGADSTSNYKVKPESGNSSNKKYAGQVVENNSYRTTENIDEKKISGVKPDSNLYRKAKMMLDEGDYKKALTLLRSIDSNFKDVRQLRASTEVFIQQEADAHYRKGISYFLSEDLENAIREWETVLQLSPNNLKAKKDLKNAKKLQKRMMNK